MSSVRVVVAVTGVLVWAAGCAEPGPPARGPDFEAVVVGVAPAGNGPLHLLVNTVPPDVSVQAVIVLASDASAFEQQPNGEFVRQWPTMGWRGRMVRVWFSHGFAVRAGEPFSAAAEAVVVEPPRSSLDP